MGHEVVVTFPPKRIVSLVPSQTELLFDLGLGSALAGITRFCVHPASLCRQVPKIGGTKKLDLPGIRALDPDIIIGNKEENERLQIETLQHEFPVWMSDIHDLEDALQMMEQLGELLDRRQQAQQLTGRIRQSFSAWQGRGEGRKVLYLIWRKPYMGAGKNTFIDTMLRYCNLQNVLEAERYPRLEPEMISRLHPDCIFLSSEPYPFKEKHIGEFRSLCPEARILLVDGEIFSWYGSRLLKAPAYFESLMRQV